MTEWAGKFSELRSQLETHVLANAHADMDATVQQCVDCRSKFLLFEKFARTLKPKKLSAKQSAVAQAGA